MQSRESFSLTAWTKEWKRLAENESKVHGRKNITLPKDGLFFRVSNDGRADVPKQVPVLETVDWSLLVSSSVQRLRNHHV